MQESLVAPVTLKEIKDVIFAMNGNKAPGSDGYSARFFQASWSIVGEEFLRAVQFFFSNCYLPDAFNSTIITLVPKVAGPVKATEFRPISCCNTVYKCITKILTNRLKQGCSLDTEFVERESVLDWSTRFIEDCIIAYNPLRTAPTVMQSSVRSWEGPPHGWVKGNMDDVVNVSNGRAAVGGVFRDADGMWLQGFVRFIGRSSVLVVELWAIREGLNQAWNGGFRQVELETDNAEAARICNGLSTVMQSSVLVSDIQEWLQRSWHVRVRYVDRASNAVADTLAKLGQRTLLQGGYFRHPPGEVLALVEAEQRHWEDRILGA
ncbi:hypothetical protein GQ457_10G002790 [Hibiscus cannabinus]